MEPLKRCVRLAAQHLLPATLFGRLALLMLGVALLSHVLALTMLFELRPPALSGPGPGPGPGPMLDLPPPGPPLWMTLGLLLDVGVRLSALALAAWVAARWLSAPIKRLAAAAHALGDGIAQDSPHGHTRPAPLPEEGPRECRDASRVFNRMQTQIQRQLAERDRFVAAVSHDLRTPLTRLRLRTESLHDAAQRDQFSHDIGEMDRMISATLDYLRGAADAEAAVRLDVQALAESVAEDQQACGRAVEVSGTALPLPAQPGALRRGLCNLVDNAVRYGGSARIVLVDGAAQLCIEVHDSGPGIAPELLDKVLEPYFRVEGSRNRQHGGVGLGLAIAHDIARQHGGTLRLRNAAAGGLVAALTLPRR